MNSGEKSMKGCAWSILLAIVVSVGLNIWLLSRPEPQPSVVIERDTVWKDTTIYKPVPAETIQTGRVVYVKIPTQGGQSPCADDSLSHTGDSPHVSADSIDVPVTIIQKRYDDSLYTAWVSGYEPNLDSIRLYQPIITETITQTIVNPSPLITFGIQAGAGYGVFSHKPDLYVGGGVQINLWRK